MIEFASVRRGSRLPAVGMRTIVHVVGESDMGLDTSKYKRESAQQARRRAVDSWREQVLSTIDDPAELHARLRSSRSLDDAGRLVVDAGKPLPPLVNLLDQISRDDEVDLVLVGTDNAQGVPSLVIAETLRILLDRHSRLLGPATRVTVAKAGFELDDIAAVVEEKVRKDGPADAPLVEILWGSGATEIALAVVSGVITSGRRWQVRRSRDPFDVIDFLPDLGYPAVVSWLLRYGHPGRVRGALRKAGVNDADLQEIADAATATLGRVADGKTTGPDDLACWVHTDVRRRNRTSSLAVRAWITAEYRRRLAAEGGGPDLISVLDRTSAGKARGLGSIIAALWESPDDLTDPQRAVLAAAQTSASSRWLKRQLAITSAAGRSAHRFKPFGPNPIARLATALGGAGEVGETDDCGPFHLPTGVVAYLWSDGRTDPGGKPTLDTVLEHPPPRELLELVATRDRPDQPNAARFTLVDLLILATEESETYALEQRRQAPSVDAVGDFHYRFRAVDTAVVEFDDPRRPAADARVPAELRAREAAEHWLSTRSVDAVVVVPTGPKQQVTGLLTAALAYGHRRAVPVFLQAVTTSPHRVGTRFHRVLPYLVTNVPVLELALASMRALAFDTAAALINLCHPPSRVATTEELDALADTTTSLTGAFFTTQPTGARERLELCAKVVHGANVVDQIRIAHVAAEMWKEAGQRPHTRFGPALVRVRDAVTVNHGEGSFRAAMDAAAAGLKMPNLKLGGLISRTAGEVVDSRVGGRLMADYDTVVSTLDRLIVSTREMENRPDRSIQPP